MQTLPLHTYELPTHYETLELHALASLDAEADLTQIMHDEGVEAYSDEASFTEDGIYV